MGCDNDIEDGKANVAEPLNILESITDKREKNVMPVGCQQPDELIFSSLEDFLLAYRALQLGEDITAFVENWFSGLSGSTLESVAKGSNLASLETLYLPVGIPDDFVIGKILVNEYHVHIAFYHIDDMVSEDSKWIADIQQRHFSFAMLFRDYDEATLFSNMMEAYGAYEESLIDGKYFFSEPNRFDWVADGVWFQLYTPLRQLSESNKSISATEIDGVSLNNPREMVVFTETRTIDLTDEGEVMALIREVIDGDQHKDLDKDIDDDLDYDLDENLDGNKGENANQDHGEGRNQEESQDEDNDQNKSGENKEQDGL